MSHGFAGIHHLALYTRDLDLALAFHSDVVALDVSDVAGSPRGRLAFVHLEPADHARPGSHSWEKSDLAEPDVDARHLCVRRPERDHDRDRPHVGSGQPLSRRGR